MNAPSERYNEERRAVVSRAWFHLCCMLGHAQAVAECDAAYELGLKFPTPKQIQESIDRCTREIRKAQR